MARPFLALLVFGLALTGCRRSDDAKRGSAEQEHESVPLAARERADVTVAVGRAAILEEHLHLAAGLSADRASSADVRAFGQRLITRHAGKAGLLRVQAASAGLSLPPPGQSPSPPGPSAGTTAEPGRFDSGPMPGTMTGGRGSGVGMSGAAPPGQGMQEVPAETPVPQRASVPEFALSTEWQTREAERIYLRTLFGEQFDRAFLELTTRAIEHVLGLRAPDAPPSVAGELDASYDRFESDLREARALLDGNERQDVSGSERTP